jgi:hypothetical protein
MNITQLNTRKILPVMLSIALSFLILVTPAQASILDTLDPFQII